MKTRILALSLVLIGMLAVTSCSKEYTVTVNSNNETWGAATGSGTYASGATATLAAVPSAGCYFVKWNDDVTDNPRTVIVTEDITYTAYFAENAGGTFSFSGKVPPSPSTNSTKTSDRPASRSPPPSPPTTAVSALAISKWNRTWPCSPAMASTSTK